MGLLIPDKFNTYTIIGIDPGINYTGISVYTLTDYNQLVSIEAFTIRPSSIDTRIVEDIDIVGERYIKLNSLRCTIASICNHYKPSAVICEGPFYSRFRPMAYASLVETLTFIRQGVYSYNPYISIVVIQPLLIKKTIGAGVMDGKVDVTRAINAHPELISVLVNDLYELDEHSQDAIAIAYTYLNLTEALPTCTA